MTATPNVDDVRAALDDPPGYVPQLSDATLLWMVDRLAPVFRQADREAFADHQNRLFVERSDAAREEAP